MKTAVLTMLTALLASATPVTVQLVGTSGVSDGSDYVLPYSLSIDGGPSFLADCYNLLATVTVGQTWSANEWTLAEAVSMGQFSSDPNALQEYELIGVLDDFTLSTPQQEIDIQHLIWDVTDPGAFAMDAEMNLDLIAATGAIPTYDFEYARYIEGATSGGGGIRSLAAIDPVQPFVTTLTGTPEPSTWYLILTGLVMIAFGTKFKRKGGVRA